MTKNRGESRGISRRQALLAPFGVLPYSVPATLHIKCPASCHTHGTPPAESSGLPGTGGSPAQQIVGSGICERHEVHPQDLGSHAPQCGRDEQNRLEPGRSVNPNRVASNAYAGSDQSEAAVTSGVSADRSPEEKGGVTFSPSPTNLDKVAQRGAPDLQAPDLEFDFMKKARRDRRTLKRMYTRILGLFQSDVNPARPNPGDLPSSCPQCQMVEYDITDRCPLCDGSGIVFRSQWR